ncbi:hypothetical protein GC105_09185 [Alkalibaculum sp. M08DMB]|uniref:Uncharacterized protein n=1 Tax=Alkalibaculum sporogenes TaxID=2655001 RepID=A0A6A7KA96_9FIRM|nr:hypothetical protein [Alkalibaculum sporogenes]MPW25963.1 hypothetical protein [Alkalibaculum sporogenes]
MGIAIYAAVVSTITLVWTIIIQILEKVPRVKISANVYAGREALEGKGVLYADYAIGIRVTNKSIYDIYITQIYVKLAEKVDGDTKYMISPKKGNLEYPIQLKSRDQFIIAVELDTMWDLFRSSNNKDKKIRIMAMDTTDKEFKSNKIELNIRELMVLAEKNRKKYAGQALEDFAKTIEF